MKTLLSKSKGAELGSEEIWQTREDLRNVCEELILTDFEFAVNFRNCTNLHVQKTSEVDLRLWKYCFYKFIEDYRKSLKSSPSPSTKRSFRAFLYTSLGFYSRLLERLCASQSLDGVLVSTQQLGIDGIYSAPTVSRYTILSLLTPKSNSRA